MDGNNQIKAFSSFERDTAFQLAKTIDSTILSSTVANHVIESEIFSRNSNLHELSKKVFINCDFQSVLFAGENAGEIKLQSCHLSKCNVIDSNFKQSDFTNSRFHVFVKSSSFDSSDFSDAAIIDSTFEGCSLSESLFFGTTLHNCSFLYSEFVGAIFEDSSLSKVDLSKANLDYTEFRHVQLSDVILPYWSVLHIVTGLTEILMNPSVRFSTSDGIHCVSKEDYLHEVFLLRPFLYEKQDYIALVNLSLLEGQTNNAYKLVVEGLSYACKSGRFSLIKHLCHIASLNNFFSKEQLKEFYNLLEQFLLNSNLTKTQYKNYMQELDSAKRLLIDCPFGRDSITITIQTNICFEDHFRWSKVLKTIDYVISKVSTGTVSHMEVRHNSPIQIVVEIAGIARDLLIIFAIVNAIFDKSTTYIERIQNIIKNHREIREQKTEHIDIAQLQKDIKTMESAIDELQRECSKTDSPIIRLTPEDYQKISYVISPHGKLPEELLTYRSR